ncbi:CRISPR-associated protein Cas5 [Schnuerera ultunensis]|uniref:CRISPR-associated protein Cas5 n=1 Tax=[Clostridium] ultunense Esp TaxID=1288971 RepID=A0A1M4PS64_9FIRM|nr:CRISPR-associated protein Cas5 [Schnuerera ultunensis]SHD78325.1 conserved protein of unknown function [[Clostridium] ultunense Esp]
MKAVVFDIEGKIGHFRRPDATVTQLTYPFIPPIVAKGLVGAILGITDFVTKDKVGIQLLSPVRTSTQQLSLLGKEGATFNRPTTMEFLVNPAYRVYYAGNEYVEELANKLKNNYSVYPTYLGVAFALTFPKYIGCFEKVDIVHEEYHIETPSAVPTSTIKKLIFEEGYHYSRAGGFMKDYLGERQFEKSISYIYEKDMKNIKFLLEPDNGEDCLVANIGGEFICLV